MIRAAVLSMLLLAGCETPSVPLGQQSPQGNWVITRIGGQEAAGEGHVHFDPPGGQIKGRAPCNSFSGASYTLAGARILSTDGAVTEMACLDQQRQARERIFLDVLFQSPHFVIYGDVLQLTGPSGAVVELRRAPG